MSEHDGISESKGEMIIDALEDFLHWREEVLIEKKEREERGGERGSWPPLTDSEENMSRSREEFVRLLDSLSRES
jgi:hypothetical protein